MATSRVIMPEDASNVLPLLLLVSGYAAQERGASVIEPKDLLKAIYIVDLEHVQAYWDNWEDFERIISGEGLMEGGSGYINRTVYLIRVVIDQNEAPSGCFRGVGHPSEAVSRIVEDARTLANKRTRALSTPSSRDLLVSMCAQDPSLSKILQDFGLNLESLIGTVDGSRR